MSRGTPPAIITDTPEMIRIKKAQEQLSEVLLITGCDEFSQTSYNAVAVRLENMTEDLNLICEITIVVFFSFCFFSLGPLKLLKEDD